MGGGVNFNLKRPCANCPFRTDIRPFLRRDQAQQIADSLLDQQQTFACHKTVDYSEAVSYTHLTLPTICSV